MLVGNDAGWHLHFATTEQGQPVDVLSIGSGDYYGEIAATLAGGLEGGAYRFMVEGITNAHYRLLHDKWTRRLPLGVDLYLYWRDTSNGPRRLANFAGLTDLADSLARLPSKDHLVARLVVTRLSRRVGRRRYEAVIEARERVYDALSQRLQTAPRSESDPLRAAAAVARALTVEAVEQPAKTPPPAGGPPIPVRAGTPGLRALADLEQAMAACYGKAGRGMYLIRDGTLHIGPGRPVPLEGETLFLDDSAGLAHVETTGISQSEPNPDATADTVPARGQYSIVLKGRPDLKPGSRVMFLDPLEGDVTTPASFGEALSGLGTALLGGGAVPGVLVDLYVSGVSHQLSRTEGFVTTVSGVEMSAGSEFDQPRATPWGGEPDPDPAPMADGAVATAIQKLVQTAAPEPLDVAEVRAGHTTAAQEPPAQTVDVWVGAVASDGLPFRARRLAIDRASKSRLAGVPYATPFAWGKCGLVLPRYPGSRVLLGHRGGDADDAVELGAIWESGHGPESQPGDWWLILPAAVDATKRAVAADTETPQEPSGTATNDLIDADGSRVIEVGRLTVRVSPTKLAAPGTRPIPPSDSSQQITIEHENGSRLVITDNGDIRIEAKGNLTLTATKTVSIDADDVKVTVKKTMDVS